MITKYLVFWVLTQVLFVSQPGIEHDDYGRNISGDTKIELVKTTRKIQNVKAFSELQAAEKYKDQYLVNASKYNTEDFCTNFKIDSVKIDTNKTKDLSLENLVKIYNSDHQ